MRRLVTIRVIEPSFATANLAYLYCKAEARPEVLLRLSADPTPPLSLLLAQIYEENAIPYI